MTISRSTWTKAAELWAFSRDIGQPIPDADIVIAAQSIDLEAVLVSANADHFEPFRPLGLRLENWITQ